MLNYFNPRKILLLFIIFLTIPSFMIYSQATSVIIDDYRKYEPEIPGSDIIVYDKKIDIFVNLINYQVIDKSTINLEIEIQKLQLSGFESEEQKKK